MTKRTHLTICFYTVRKEPCIEWFFDSLKRQQMECDDVAIVIVDSYADNPERRAKFKSLTTNDLIHVPPKPNVWQGPYRLTTGIEWATFANPRNTGLCYAEDGWIAWVDDRSVLCPTWFSSLRYAMDGNYAVAGAYEKRRDMVVEDGQIVSPGIVTGKDIRVGKPDSPVDAPGNWWFGGTSALPVEWALSVNGVDETCDGLGLEDAMFGMMLKNSGYPIKYDTRMKVIEDRTPGLCEYAYRRADKGVSPNDKSHALVKKLENLKRAIHPVDIRELRRIALEGGQLPIPTEPRTDWWDGQKLEEM